ncbi:MAG TPA: SprT-like domain-containing protein [Acidobacteriaceae bacterium]|nr:SprT-like domain-containing protein [Acidobacteriaceae bacterium]
MSNSLPSQLDFFSDDVLTHAPRPRSLAEIFATEYRALRPRAPMPVFEIRFYRFTSVNTTIRLREGRALVRLSDVLEGAPESVLAAIAHILLAKLYRKPIEAAHALRYRKHLGSASITERAEQVRRSRGRKRISSARGHVYDLDEIFDELNQRFFQGLLGRPVLTWSAQRARRLLGHYDAAHNTIVVSRVFDTAQTPRFAIEYLLYHEMLHLKHPVLVRGGRRCVHSREFQQDEKRFPDLDKVKEFLKTL